MGLWARSPAAAVPVDQGTGGEGFQTQTAGFHSRPWSGSLAMLQGSLLFDGLTRNPVESGLTYR